MICDKCNNEAIKNVANNNEFWYCRACKNEVFPPALTVTMSDSDSEQTDIVFNIEDVWRALTSTGGL